MVFVVVDGSFDECSNRNIFIGIVICRCFVNIFRITLMLIQG